MTTAGRVPRSRPVGRVSRSGPGGQEWRQFALLRRDSVRRLLNAAMLSRDGDPWQFAIWITALLGTPSFLYALAQIAKYTALRAAPAARIAPVIVIDRLFFVVYAIVTAALIAAITWEALVPDRTDQEIVGVLPVRPRTLAAARLAGAFAIILMFSAAVHLPTALIFAFIAAANPVVGALPLVFLGHAAATIGAAVATFAALLVVRGLAAIALTTSAANALAGVLQLASVAALIETFLYLPSVLPYLARQMLGSTPQVLRLPPIWFTAIYGAIGGPSREVMVGPALVGIGAVGATIAAATAVYLLPSKRVARRVLSASSKEATRYAASVIRATSRLLSRRPAVRAIVAFTLGTFTRSRRHVFIVLTYVGFAVGIGAISVISATVRRTLVLQMPASYLIALPLVWIFFVVLGLRTAFNIPVDFDANWPFRLIGTRVVDAAGAARRAMLVVAVLPAAAAAGTIALALGWGLRVAATLLVFDMVTGALLVQAVAFGWDTVPFARAHTPAVQNIRSRALVVLVPLYLFAFKGADAQLAALQSVRGTVTYMTVMAIACSLLALISRRESRRHGLTFDNEEPDALTTLSLSEAL